MRTNATLKVLLLLLLVSVTASAAIVSRITTFTDGSVLFASDLNSEFNNLVDGVNNINNDNIITGANISPAKISASIAGSGMTRDGSTGALSPLADGISIDIGGSGLEVMDLGVTTAKLAANAVTTAKITDANVTAAKLASDSVTTVKILDANVTKAKLAALGQQVSSSSGSFLTSSASYIDVTNLSVTITTTGRPVHVGLISDGTSGNSYIGAAANSGLTATVVFNIVRDSTEISDSRISTSASAGITAPAINLAPSSLMTIDTGATAASHTYKVQVKVLAGFAAQANLVKLVAYEL